MGPLVSEEQLNRVCGYLESGFSEGAKAVVGGHKASDRGYFVEPTVLVNTNEDMKVVRAFLTDDDLREALEHAPPGIIDPRSWAYWNSKLGRYPAPPLPRRRLG